MITSYPPLARRLPLLVGTALFALHAPLAAQEAAPPAGQPSASAQVDDPYGEEEIVVVGGTRERGAVIGDIPPENQLDARDIRATGATSIAELLEAIAPQTSSARGRDGGGGPVVLLNGRRTSGFREIRDLPPEAIQRVDILPEEVALKYGYRADQRVVNIVLRPRFRSTTARIEGEVPTEGGRSGGELDVTRLMLNENGRTTLNLHLEGVTALTESERDIAAPAAGFADARDFRTLSGSRELARIGGTINRTILGDVSATLDGQIETTDGGSLLGRSLVNPGEPLRRDTDATSGRLGVALNTSRGRWQWSMTGAYDVVRNLTLTDREDAAGTVLTRDRARSTNSSAALDLVASGPLAELPAGRASVTVKAAADTRDSESRTRRASGLTEVDLGRDRLSSSLNVDLPVAKRNGAWGAIGNLTLNANAEVEELSDFGTLTTLGGGLFWSPTAKLNLVASYTREQGAPGLQQLGDPTLVTPNTRIFDFRLGQTVLVDAITGGNPDLDSDTRKVSKLGATFKPLDETDVELRADYVRSRTDDVLARFPGPTAAIEAAFPERFVRDAAGNLVRVDLRPVNFDSAARDELRWGINFTKPLKSAQPSQSVMDQIRRARAASGGTQPPGPPRGAGQGARAPGAGGGPRGGGGFGPFGGGQGGRLTLSAYHTLLLRDEVVIRPGLPVVDYLDGEAADTGGGRARHRIEVETGYFNNGLGARLSGTWQSGSTVAGGTSGNLDFAPLTKINLRLFANLGEKPELVLKHPWLRGTQVRLGVDNLFDAKQRVRDGSGATPVNYQTDLLDPIGRSVSISFRKLFLPPRSFFRRATAAPAAAPTTPADPVAR